MNHAFGILSQRQLEEAWPQVHKLLSKAERYSQDNTTAAGILSLAREGRAHVFALITPNGIEAAMAMTFTTDAKQKTMNIAMFGGKHTRLIFERYGDKVQQFARDCGATRITAWCRPSAARLFNSITGTKTIYHLISKDLP
ncbi:MAG: hypothetical protein Q7T25_06165 [Sideroxyarcus sp.]|nr:hypothetical protein [Sideroxyarcus sp.]